MPFKISNYGTSQHVLGRDTQIRNPKNANFIVTVNNTFNNDEKIMFNHKYNDCFHVIGKDVIILQEVCAVFEINFFIDFEYSYETEHSYQISKLKMYKNNELFHEKKYGFDANNMIRDNIFMKLNIGDEISFSTDSTVNEKSFVIISIDQE